MGDCLVTHDVCVAVIEDDSATREVIAVVLEDAGYRVTAWNGLEAVIPFIARVQPDLLIQDLRIGTGFSIWDLLDHVDGIIPGLAPRVLLCSADIMFIRTHRAALEARSCAIIEKPFEFDTFLGAIEACLEPSRT